MTDLTSIWPLGLNRRNWPLFLLGLLALLAAVVSFDHVLSQAALSWPVPVRDFFAGITDYGLSDWVLIPSLLVTLLALLWWRLARRRLVRLAAWETFGVSLFIFVGVGLPGLVTNIIKRIIGRGRPELFDQVGMLHFQSFANNWLDESFPSGHSTTAVGLAFVVGFLAPRYFRVFLAIGLIVAVSRVAVGAHYPTDVLAGAAIGTIGAYVVRNRFAAWRLVFKRRGDHVTLRHLVALRRLLRRQRPR